MDTIHNTPGASPARAESNGPPTARDRVPPHNLDAEVAVLGAALLSRPALAEIVEIVSADDFYRSAHRTTFEAIFELFRKGEVIDPITVADQLQRLGKLDDIGGASGIHDLVASVPTAANAAYHARIVREKAMLRRLVDAGTQVVQLGYDGGEDVNQTIDRAEQVIYDVAQGRVSSEYAPLKDLLSEGFERIEQRFENRSEVTGLPTGFNDLDRLTAGLQNQNLVILAARPAMGKSSLSLGVAQYVTVELRRPAVIFSLEMSKAEIVDRMLSSEARIDSFKIRTGRLDDTDWASLSDAMGRLAEAPLFIDDTAAITLMEIRAKCRRLKQRHGLDLVVVDYLQLMQSHRRTENRVQEVSEISRGLKMIAKELDVPVLALSQLSRQPEARTDKRPQLADLRESGCLTADTRVMRADTGEHVPMGELYRTGARDIPVWTLDDDLRLVRGRMTHVFSSGVKEVYELSMRSGRSVKASANHPFLTFDGWRALEDLAVGDRLAVPRRVDDPTAPQEMDADEIVLLAHLIGDGCVAPHQPVHYTSDDEDNRAAVESCIGSHGRRGDAVAPSLELLSGVVANPNVDTIPRGVWGRVREIRSEAGMTEREFQAAISTAYCGTTLYRSSPSRARLTRVAAALDSAELDTIARSDVLWDEIRGITHLGSEEVFDATVPGTHNFVANGIVAHNSIEQDADLVGFIYRDEVYDKESADRGVAELIIAKHRNGPTGVVKLAFLDHLTKFANLQRATV